MWNIKNLFQSRKKEYNNDFYPVGYGIFEDKIFGQSDYLRLYRTWAFACINIISETLSNQDTILLNAKGGKPINNPLYSLITPEIIQGIRAFLKLSGNAYLLKIRPTGKKIERLEILRPDLLFPEYDSYGFISFYRYNGYSAQQIFYPDDLIVFKTFSPLASYTIDRKGVGEMEAVSLEAEIDNASSKFNWNFFKNNASPSGILTTDQLLDERVSKRLMDSWNAKYKGLNNSNKTAILSGGLKYQAVAISQKDMELIEQRKFTRDEILAIFKVPKSMLGLSETVNVGNVKAFDNIFKSITIQPLATYIESVLNATLFKGIGYFQFVNIVPLDEEALEKDFNNGAITINEYRTKKGYAVIEGGDLLKINPTQTLDSGKVLNTPVKTLNIPVKKEFKSIAKNILEAIKGTESYKQKLWENKIKRNDKYENQYKKELLKIFDIQEKDTLKQIKSIKDFKAEQLSFKFDDIKYLTLYHLLIGPIQDDLVKQEGTLAFAEINLNEIFKIGDPQIKKYLYDNINKWGKEIDSTTKEDILKTIDEGLQEGLGADEIKGKIKDVFTTLKTSRLEKIVRSETIRASDYAMRTAREESGVVESKEWYTALDERVCQHCGPMNGKIIGLKEDFFKKGEEIKGSEGGVLKLDYENVKGRPLHVSCRCTLIPIIKE